MGLHSIGRLRRSSTAAVSPTDLWVGTRSSRSARQAGIHGIRADRMGLWNWGEVGYQSLPISSTHEWVSSRLLPDRAGGIRLGLLPRSERASPCGLENEPNLHSNIFRRISRVSNESR